MSTVICTNCKTKVAGRGTDTCRVCIKTSAQALGRKGGLATSKKLGKEHYRKISIMGNQAKREKVLESFTLEDLSNPVTALSVRQKLEQIDSGGN